MQLRTSSYATVLAILLPYTYFDYLFYLKSYQIMY